jgi:hypothetical protein
MVLATIAVAQDTPPAKDDPQELGRSLTTLFYEGKLDNLWAVFGKGLRDAMGSVEQLRAFHKKVADQVGEETAIVSESVNRRGDLTIYTRHAKFAKVPDLIEVVWGFNDNGVIETFVVRPPQKPADSPHLEYQTKTQLRLPFDGAWYVFWGGRTLEQNYHVVAKDQRFAYDIIIMKDGSSHAGDGAKNEEYHCFGKSILAPGDGTVVAAVDGIADNAPGVMNSKQPVGNHVVIDHGNGEFSFLAHLKEGSVEAKNGAKVKAGDILGLCGNSGNTSEPHLHYHLQTTATFKAGEGLPAQFKDYMADGKAVAKGEPTKGQTVEHQSIAKP